MRKPLLAAAAAVLVCGGLMPVAQADIAATLEIEWDSPPKTLETGTELVARVDWDANYDHGYVDGTDESETLFEFSVDSGYFMEMPDQCGDGSDLSPTSLSCVIETPDDDGIAGHMSIPVRAWGNYGAEVAVSVSDPHGNTASTPALRMIAQSGIDIALNAAGVTDADFEFRRGLLADTLVPVMVAIPYGAAPLVDTVTVDLEITTDTGPSVFDLYESLEVVPVPDDRRVIGIAANGPNYEVPDVEIKKIGAKTLRLTIDVSDDRIGPATDPRGSMFDRIPVASFGLHFQYPVYSAAQDNNAISWTAEVTHVRASASAGLVMPQAPTTNDLTVTSFVGIGTVSAKFVNGHAPNAGGILAEPGDDPEALPQVHREVWDQDLGTGTLSAGANHWLGRGPILPGDQMVGIVNSAHYVGYSPSDFTKGTTHGYCLIFDRERGTTSFNGMHSVTGLTDYKLEYLSGDMPGGFMEPDCNAGTWTEKEPADVTAIRVLFDPATQGERWITRPILGAGYLVAEDLGEGERAWMAGSHSLDITQGWSSSGYQITPIDNDPYEKTTYFRDAVVAVPSRTSVQLDTPSDTVTVGEQVDWEVTTRVATAPFADRADHTVQRRLVLPVGVELAGDVDATVTTEGGRTVLEWESSMPAGTAEVDVIPTTYRFGTGTLTAEVEIENLTGEDLTTDSDSASVVALASAGAHLEKTATASEFALDGSNRWTVSLENRDVWPIAIADTIDILPYEGDGRATVTSADITVTDIGGGEAWVSTADPADISPDPLAASNGSVGRPTELWERWSGQDGVTAVRWITSDFGPGMVETYSIDYEVAGATNGDVLVNSAQTRTSGAVTTMINSSSTTNVGKPADLQVDKRLVGEDSVLAEGETLTFEITAHGAGPGTVRGAVLADIPVMGLKDPVFENVSVGTGDGSVWRIGDIPEGEVVTATVTATATGGPIENMVVGDTCENCVPVKPPTCEPNVDVYSDTDRCDVVTAKEEPILQIDKSLVGSLPEIGTVTYDITVRNGAEAADGVVTAGTLIDATDLTGVGLDPETVAFSDLSQGDAEGPVWHIGTLRASAEATATVTAEVLPESLRVVNAISVSNPAAPRELNDPSEAVPNDDVYSDTDQADVEDVAREGRLAINKEFDRLDDGTIYYVIEVGNLGGEPIAGVTVTDIPGAKLGEMTLAEPTVGTVEGLVWDVGDLEPGQVETILAVATVEPSADHVINQVFVEGEGFPHGGTFVPNPTLKLDDDQGDTVATDVPIADLRIDKRVISAEGVTGVFEIETCNVGLAPAHGVTVTDLGGTNITSLTSEDDRFSEDVFFLGTLGPGDCETLSIEAEITGSGDNVAFVDSPNDPIDEDANQPNDSIEDDIDGWDIVEFEVTPTPVRPELPLTGPSAGAMILGSVLLLGLGAGTVIATRRRIE